MRMDEVLFYMLSFLYFLIKISPKTKKWFWKKWYTLFASKAPNPEFRFMNYGYYKDGFHPELDSSDEIERFPIQLYHHVTSQIELKGKSVLEVGSGRGGGAFHIAQYLRPLQMTGIDISDTAVELCNSIYDVDNLKFVVGDSENIPFDDEQFDVVINVESSHCYGSMQSFLRETFRILKPGGFFLFCDLRETSAVNELLTQFKISGLQLIENQDITENIIEALNRMSTERKETINHSVPRILKRTFESYAGVKGSKMYDSFSNGTLRYLSACLQKPV